MPMLNVNTNVPLDAVVISDILKDASKAIARLLSKPESYVMISIRHGVPMSMGGSEEPTAYAELISIGGLTPPNNKKISAAISEILEKKASIDPGRFYLKFTDVKGSDIGYNGSTF
ncbi:phenylpyruvate tautomerase [Marchantia polymorpha subsp. ruderalis]|uniref:L-dopachrome isomerase n=2 Tax=Marchantia polymorpha TaxID=3197 RepID=A0AAF6BNQ3_MARPO|nr:hypothetical protein MARPO_0034s0002 [Marchantia polymorpha]BBN13637.1 hypothetical protein Mp_6g05160 [Marchantia polymorpha subsp. ruderalis]|eukprot:PTQ41392.1 hypothetical protein MARPO_0034s0002 [Marchantia polymorpha]